MSLKALSDYTFYSRYSQYDKEKNRRETWDEAIHRVFNMHRIKYANELKLYPELEEKLNFAERQVIKKRVLGSQRALQYGGDDTLRKNLRLYNCCGLHINKPKAFQDVTYMLLMGNGVGYSVQYRHVNKLPQIQSVNIEDKITYIIPDSCEGWADSIGILLSSYFETGGFFPEYKGKYVDFDYSLIRPKGSLIANKFKAPGPEPLKKGIEKIRNILNEVAKENRKLKPIEVYDMLSHCADFVISAGLRRCIAKGSRVLTKEGSFKNIENIIVGDEVSTDNGWKKVVNIFEQGKQKTIRINHQDGYLDCTPNHRVAVLTDCFGSFEWKNAEDLKSGDRLYFKYNENKTGVNKLPDFTYEKPLHSTSCKDIIIPELDEKMAWFLGEFHGDGYVKLRPGSGYVSVAVEGTNPKKKDDIIRQFERFGVNCGVTYPKEKDNCYKIHVKSKQLATYFHSWLKQPKTCINVPDCIKNATENVKIAYIQGVLDADGSIGKKCQQVVCSIYEPFVKDLQSLLYSVGIISRYKKLSTKGLKENWHEKYGLFLLNNNDRERFNLLTENLGYKKFVRSKCQNLSNSYPVEFLQKIENRPKGFFKKIALNSNAPYSTFNLLFDDNNIRPIMVNSIETNKIEVETYDIEVEDNHNFICEGVLVHNSAVLVLFSKEDTEMMSAKTGSWFFENPQRARSNNSVVLKRDEITKKEFAEIFKNVKEFGEPGTIFVENFNQLVNPCLSKDCVILTKNGPKLVNELIGQQFTAIVNGKEYNSTELGFFKTGYKPLFKLKTKQGFEIELTDNHKVLLKNGIWKEAKDLCIGDEIVIHDHNNIVWDGFGNKNEGWLVGNLLGDGTFTKTSAFLDYWGKELDQLKKESINRLYTENLIANNEIKVSLSKTYNGIKKCRIRSNLLKQLSEKVGIDKHKKITNLIYNTSSDFVIGFLQGWFDADGTVQKDDKKQRFSVRLSSNNESNLIIAQRLLNNLGIYSKIYRNRKDSGFRKLPDGRGGIKEYFCKTMHELIISKEDIVKFYNIIGFTVNHKRLKLYELVSSYKRGPYKTNKIAKFESLEYFKDDDVYDCTIPEIGAFDCNGLYVHNCAEISWIIEEDEDALCTIGVCNLSEINGKYCVNEENFLKACEAAAIIGTFQAGYTDFPYLGKKTEDFVKDEALIGVSITGWMDNPDVLFNPDILEKGASRVIEVNKEISKLLGINPASRCCTAKPSGHTSCILGTASGVHPHHAKRYIRRVQSNKQEKALEIFKNKNPIAVEESVWSANNTDEVISFLCEVPLGAITKNQLSAIELLEKVKLAQTHWVIAGVNTEKNKHKNLSHSVSNTITVKNDEWEDVEEYIYQNRKYFTGISLLPASGDLDYDQAPFSTVLTPAELVREYGDASVFASGLIVDGLAAFNNNLWKACDTVLGIGEILNTVEEPIYPTTRNYKDLSDYFANRERYEEYFLKKDWIRRINQFANRYFGGNLRKATYCLKHVSMWKTWCDLSREYKEVVWENVQEIEQEYKNINEQTAVACHGGSCDII